MVIGHAVFRHVLPGRPYLAHNLDLMVTGISKQSKILDETETVHVLTSRDDAFLILDRLES